MTDPITQARQDTLTPLATRLEEAEASRELDAEIALAMGAVVEPAVRDSFSMVRVPAWWTMPGISRDIFPHRTSPWPLTSSLDAALALVGEKLPDYSLDFDLVRGNKPPCSARLYRVHSVRAYQANGATPALALLAALLKALAQSPEATNAE